MTVDESSVRARPAAGAAPDSFREQLSEFQASLESDLRTFLEGKQAELTAEVAEAAELTSRLDQYVLRGGKRLRPALLYHGYLACGGESRDTVMPAALAVELLHTYLLIHDDIMDRAPTRRGAPTAHLVFRDDHRSHGWRGDAEHHGESVAILLGDLAHCYAEELFSRAASRQSDPRVRRCFDTMCQEVITGQYLELTAGHRERLTEEDLLQVLRMKSGRYSVERPIQLGALLAGAPEPLLEKLSEFGLLVGEAFQLHDDLLGMFGDRAVVGKPVGGDLVEGKHTLLVHYALASGGDDERRQLLRALGHGELGAAEIERATDIIRGTGAEARVREMVDSRHRQAAAILAELELEPAGKRFFSGLVGYLQERNL